MKQAPEQFRVDIEKCKRHGWNPQGATDSTYGNNGVFILPRKGKTGNYFQCIVSDGMGWEHVSITIMGGEKRCPTWEEMCYIKSVFWEDSEAVMELHPPKENWVSNHPYCLHLWKPNGQEIPLPLDIMVGVKELNQKENNQE